MILVVGCGRTGRALERHLRARGREVVVVEDATPRPDGTIDTAAGLAVVHEAELVVPSPGVRPSHPILAAAVAGGVEIASEIDLAGAELSAPIVAVTGTNGKTTVTTLVGEMLGASGLRVAVAGNIGRPLLEVVGDDVDVVVAEVSSFQLATSRRFHPNVAVLLNVADDHLDWHGTFDAYAAAKGRIFAAQTPDDVAVIPADDAVVADLAATGAAARATFSGEGAQANVAAATVAARAAGATEEGIAEGARRGVRLPHRMEPVGEAGGVRWVNDSKATNPHAASHGLARFDSVVLIAGGRNKSLDLTPLSHHGERLRGVVAIGESAPEVVAAFAETSVPVRPATSMEEAVDQAQALARPGDTVLLAPACTSFDWYGSYEERGDDFRARVRARLDAQGAA